VVSTINVDIDMYVSHVQVFLAVNHNQSSGLEVMLTSPMGTVSILAELSGYAIYPFLNIMEPSDTLFSDTPITAAGASFGPQLNDTSTLSGNLSLAVPLLACSNLTNAAQIAGNIAVVQRGTCAFTDKVQAAQDAGAIGVVVINNFPGSPMWMGGSSSSITIPSIMIDLETGTAIMDMMTTNNTVFNVFLNALKWRDDEYFQYENWPFMSVRHWGESSAGNWSLSIIDQWDDDSYNYVGSFISWQLVLYKGLEYSIHSSESSDDGDDIDWPLLAIILPACMCCLAIVVVVAIAAFLIRHFIQMRDSRYISLD